GATAKVEALDEEFSSLVTPRAFTASVSTSVSSEDTVAALDLLGLLKASETLSSQVVLDRLLEKLMDVCLEVAGAERGVLVLEEEDALVVRVIGSVSEPVSLVEVALRASDQLPQRLVEQVFHSGEPIVLADAARQGAFTADPYVVAHKVKSA